MADPFVFCAPDPRERPLERVRAMACIAALGQRWPLVLWPVANHDDYSRGMAEAWAKPGTMINVEHDMGALPSHVDELLACPYDACAFAYWIAPATTGRLTPVVGVRLLPGETRWAYDTAVGLCKIEQSRRRGVIPICNYKSVETYMWARVGFPWHIHWPTVPHYHGFSETQYALWKADGQRTSD